MQFIIKDPNETIVSLARKIGYRPIGVNNNEYSIIRPLAGRDYPRFHAYVKKDNKGGIFNFNLHLDQRQPSYEGSLAHSGEYAGEVLEKEVGRIKKLVGKAR